VPGWGASSESKSRFKDDEGDLFCFEKGKERFRVFHFEQDRRVRGFGSTSRRNFKVRAEFDRFLTIRFYGGRSDGQAGKQID
jgi:hypothetical protein